MFNVTYDPNLSRACNSGTHWLVHAAVKHASIKHFAANARLMHVIGKAGVFPLAPAKRQSPIRADKSSTGAGRGLNEAEEGWK